MSGPRLEMEGISRWVVAVFWSHMVRRAALDLNQAGFRAYCPLGRKIVYRGRARSEARVRRIQEFPVFGSYLFVGEAGRPLQRESHRGLIDIIGDRYGAWPLNPKLVQAINEAELSGKWDTARTREWENQFRIGDRVRVCAGPFEGFMAIVGMLNKSGAVVDLDVFGRKNKVTIEPSKLELA